MNLRVIKEGSLVQSDIGYFTDIVPSTIRPMVKFKKVSLRAGKKKVSEFFGELVHLDDSSDIKVLLPLLDTAEFGIPHKVKHGDFFMGKQQIMLSNPKRLAYQDVVICDIELYSTNRRELKNK